ncbi:MAG: ubiquinone/menaquinone biosynthesis methyltransferase [Proteobacteria bacterium]|nr:ubiquinone/menaquinone biosynthesis methyltransferase [Pseudomonadota bacterium]
MNKLEYSPSKIKGMFDDIVDNYDFLNHTLSFFQDYYWRYKMTNELNPVKDKLIMDLAVGTGDSSVGIVRRGGNVIGVDLSYKMLRKTKKKFLNKQFKAIQASVYELPFKDQTFDGLCCAFGIRNMHERNRALKEIHRILKKNSFAVFLEFSMPKGIIKPIYTFYLKAIMTNIASLFSKRSAYTYLRKSIEGFPSPERFLDEILSAGFNCGEFYPLSLGTVYIHKAYKI